MVDDTGARAVVRNEGFGVNPLATEATREMTAVKATFMDKR